ncbi:hypothetical protein EBT16_06285, partial [bacterium]|nr:hypothetical protein [bacterium]
IMDDAFKSVIEDRRVFMGVENNRDAQQNLLQKVKENHSHHVLGLSAVQMVLTMTHHTRLQQTNQFRVLLIAFLILFFTFFIFVCISLAQISKTLNPKLSILKSFNLL